jgi:hypothetical protein
VKADKTVRLLKTVPPVQVGFTAGSDPVINTISGQNSSGWTVVAASNSPTNELISLTWEDTIDISGISAADLSLINQGGALTVWRLPACSFPETGSVVFTTYVSVNPIRGTFSERYLYGNSLATPGESQDWFLATSQTYTRDSTGAGWMNKIAENNWGTGGIASSNRLFIKCFVQIDRLALYVPGVPPAVSGFALFDGAPYLIDLSPTTIGMMAITAEMDAVQTAAAIYRGNDLQQSYDES